ncbi:Methyltransferase domain-containing protein [Streptomyces zhaozhouensis]|uniref:Methyltransferase domain-containing protein n=1 Tax=Streptomyces zhaozhouensis TaxID=1300267 RepID=A0A286DTN4_9ACTN|nr:methyltransferase domain-containing protein [Streptomyces zhaozhouensis]SOD62001.1 Methyltransferase domain-containing protein [Streptomyces zhaozhouensis]
MSDALTPHARHLITHAEHPVAAPLAEASVDAVLAHALGRGRAAPRLLDLGCGQAAWPLRALAGRPDATAVGVDLNAGALEWARTEADRRGVGERLELVAADAGAYGGEEAGFDAVLCVGSTHAFGGLEETLAAAGRQVAPGGTLVAGEGFWEREPTPAALGGLGAVPSDFADLAGTVDRCLAAGWTPVHGHVSSAEEWDAYEWAWTGSLASWALDHPDHPAAAEAAAEAAEHRTRWLGGYRGVLGFVTLVLRAWGPQLRTGG